MFKQPIQIFVLLIVSIWLAGCSHFLQPKHQGKGWYLVKPTDTLYSVAWRYNIDFQKLARWNGLSTPYKIMPGQYLRMIAPPNDRSKALVKASPTKNKLKKKASLPIKWQWPVKGQVLNKFALNDINKRGIDIASKVGQPVRAIAAGKVVYSGNGLAGYKNLIIIKHSDRYLSAYSQNKNILVKEGDQITMGSKIADMGKNETKDHHRYPYVLHFQIRENGNPIDPMRFLPK